MATLLNLLWMSDHAGNVAVADRQQLWWPNIITCTLPLSLRLKEPRIHIIISHACMLESVHFHLEGCLVFGLCVYVFSKILCESVDTLQLRASLRTFDIAYTFTEDYESEISSKNSQLGTPSVVAGCVIHRARVLELKF